MVDLNGFIRGEGELLAKTIAAAIVASKMLVRLKYASGFIATLSTKNWSNEKTCNQCRGSKSHKSVLVRESRHPLPPVDMLLFAPLDRDLLQRFAAERKPSRLHLVAPKHVLEMPESALSVNGSQQFLTEPFPFHGG